MSEKKKENAIACWKKNKKCFEEAEKVYLQAKEDMNFWKKSVSKSYERAMRLGVFGLRELYLEKAVALANLNKQDYLYRFTFEHQSGIKVFVIASAIKLAMKVVIEEHPGLKETDTFFIEERKVYSYLRQTRKKND